MNNYGQYPQTRLRRTRSSLWIRDLVQEHHVHVTDLIWPVFVVEGKNIREDITSLPGVQRYSIDILIEEVRIAADLGIPAIAVFPVTPQNLKCDQGEESFNPDNLICRAVSAIKAAVPNIGIITDVALDPYTSHGHDGVIYDGVILNDETIEILSKQAVVQAQAGADIIAPSDMMDGRVGALRVALDKNKFSDVSILSYAAKYASGFYGPFRDAVGSKGCLGGDKKTYQMNPANKNEAIKEVALDLQEGADMVIVKPGMPYLDIVSCVKDTFKVPTFAYHVSGEYAMLRAACDQGWLDYEQTILETMISFKRAGCDGVLTYAARDVAKFLRA